MNLLFNSSEEYLPFLKTTFLSFYKHNKGQHNVFLFHVGISEDNTNNLKRFFRKHNAALFLYQLDTSVFKSIELKYKTYHYVVMGRLMAPELLPTKINRILYFDLDIIINGNLQSFYDMDFNGNALIAVKDEWSDYHKRRFNYQNDYFCAGFMLMNLAEIRKTMNEKSLVDYIQKNGDQLDFLDQDILNYFFQDKRILVDSKYDKIIPSSKLTNEEIKNLSSNIVLHYGGITKPWHKNWKNRMSKFFFKYYRKVNRIDAFRINMSQALAHIRLVIESRIGIIKTCFSKQKGGK